MGVLHLRSTVDVRSLLPEVDTRYITSITIIMRAIVLLDKVRRLGAYLGDLEGRRM